MSFTPHRATFDEFGWRDGAGRVHFASQRQTPIAQAAPGPGLAGAQPLQRPRVRKSDQWCQRHSSVSGIRTSCSIDKAAMLSVLRPWCPDSRLDACT